MTIAVGKHLVAPSCAVTPKQIKGWSRSYFLTHHCPAFFHSSSASSLYLERGSSNPPPTDCPETFRAFTGTIATSLARSQSSSASTKEPCQWMPRWDFCSIHFFVIPWLIIIIIRTFRANPSPRWSETQAREVLEDRLTFIDEDVMDWLKDEIYGIKEGIREITEHLLVEHVDEKLIIMSSKYCI